MTNRSRRWMSGLTAATMLAGTSFSASLASATEVETKTPIKVVLENSSDADFIGSVYGEVLKEAGATFIGRPAKEGVEFLASPNDWFRPVSVTTGPDGALYVVDMCRAVIEHPDFMPPELKTRRDLTWGKEHGRIWRIVPENAKPRRVKPNLSKATTAALVRLLDEGSPWWSTTAQRLLLERQDAGAVEPLRKMVREGGATGGILAAHILEQMVFLDEPSILKLLGDAAFERRLHGLLLAEPRLEKSPELIAKIRSMGNDPSPRVRYQVALTLSTSPSPEDDDTLLSVLLKGAGDSWTRLAVRIAMPPGKSPNAIEGRVERFLGRVIASKALAELEPKTAAATVEELAELMGHEETGRTLLSAKMPAHLRQAFYLGLSKGLRHRRLNLETYYARLFPRKADDPTYAVFQEFLKETTTLAADAKAEPDDRLAAIRLLGQVGWERAVGVLPALIAAESRQELRLAAVRSLAAHDHPDLPKILLADWRTYTPAVRREVTEALFRNADSQLALLKAMEAKTVRPGDLDSLRSRQLLLHKTPAVRVLAEKLLKENVPGDRQEALKKYRTALDMKGDPARGKEIFRKNCATCHRVGGIGVDVGPDIADTRTKTLDALLVDIILPNAAIDNNYVQYIATTKSGKSITGILVNETAVSLTFKRAEGQADVILRSELDELQSTGLSLMPDGLEKNINVAEMADLLHFLKNWRYLDGSVPFGK